MLAVYVLKTKKRIRQIGIFSSLVLAGKFAAELHDPRAHM
jgi:hypothetical protein